MGTISSGVGLMSGMDIQGTVKALMQIEARPKKMLEERVATLIKERTAFLELNALLLAVKGSVSGFDETDFFQKRSATSSNENVIRATAGEDALPGTYSFTVESLVTNHQMISAGFGSADRDRVGAGTLSFDSRQSLVNHTTPLAALNGGLGIGRGKIRVTDRSGSSADIDLSTAVTVDDVLKAINQRSEINVTASVQGGHLVLTDNTGQTTANLSVSNVGLTQTASDLGIAGTATGEQLVGSDVMVLTEDTSLSLLNDGNGVRTHGSLDDIRITLRDGSVLNLSLSGRFNSDTRLETLNNGAGVRLGTIQVTNRAGVSAEVDLTGATTLGEIQSRINAAVSPDPPPDGTPLDVTVTLANDHLLLTDGSGGDGTFKIEDVTGHAAEDLGIETEVEEGTIEGSDVYDIDTLGDVIRAINYDNENAGALTASLRADGLGIVLTDTSAGSGTTTVEAHPDSGSHAADDLGILGSSTTGTIASRDLVAGLNTVLLRSLNGGSGVGLGTIEVTNREGTATQIDLAGTATLAELVDAINAVSTTSKISAAVNAAGNGIVLTDTSSGTGSLIVQDVAGTTAEDLNLLINDTVAEVNSGNLQRQYLSETTRLDDLNGGRGVVRGKFDITDATGATATIDLTQGNEVTLKDVINEINNRVDIQVTASINETGDGLLLTDTSGGGGQLTVTENGGSIAKGLGILGQAEEGETTIDGSFEIRVDIDADDTLQDVAQKINASGAGARASILNDGSALNPYRLVLTSERSGVSGAMALDTGDTRLNLSTFVEARDAVVFLGESDSPTSLMLTSSTNTLDEVIPGVTVDLLATSETPTEITVAQDVESIVTDMQTFVKTFNAVIDKISQVTSFNEETYEKGILFGDYTIRQIQDRLYGMVRETVDTEGSYRRLGDIGLRIANGAKLELDEEQFRQALAADREAVEELFTKAETGAGTVLQDELAALTDIGTGTIDRRKENLVQQEDLLRDRIDALQLLLDSKEERLYRQFYAMEQALSQMSEMQASLSSLSSAAAQYSMGSSSSSSTQ